MRRHALISVFMVSVVVLLASPVSAFASGEPVIGYQQVSALTDEAQVEAEINPEGSPTTCLVQYVSEAQYAVSGWSKPVSGACVEGLGAGTSDRPALAEIAGLSIDTTYRYRFVAENGVGSVTGPEGMFVTFGVEAFAFEPLTSPTSFGTKGEPLGQESFTRAGGHPYELTTNIVLKSNLVHTGEPEGRVGVVLQSEDNETASLKDVKVQLPPGLVGNPAATPKCTVLEAESFQCSPDAQVGVLEVEEGPMDGHPPFVEPLFNVVAPAGVAAEFSARINNVANAFIDARVRSGTDYGVEAVSLNLPSLLSIKRVTVRFWGVPASPAHTNERQCLPPPGVASYPSFGSTFVGCPSKAPERPFLRMPTSCPGPLSAGLSVDAYQQPGVYPPESRWELPTPTDCGAVPFAPSIQARPTTTAGDAPTGLNVDVHVPQNEAPEGIASSDLKDATVTLPAGMAVNPSSADGLQACSEGQVGFEGFKELDPANESGVTTAQFTPVPAECPEGSKLGTVKIHTPLIEHPLEGGMYLAAPHQNPFGTLLALYLAVYDPVTGVIVKLPGKVEANHETGQLTATFDQNPQLPFEDLEVDLFSDSHRASLTTPLTCGSYAASSVLAPWDGNPASTPSSSPFPVSENCAGQESEAPNKPAFEAGTTSEIAGSYSPFVLNLSREDGSQRFGALNVTLPPGLVGKVAGVEQCPQADIEQAQSRHGEGEGALEQNSPSCPSGSEVGTVHVGAGSGAPYFVTGKAYFAGPYNGAPFSLVIVTPAIAGPFDLGTVVVRAGLFINSSTAQVTVKSDPFPTILDGIPLDIRTIQVDISRNDFTLNPTSCNAMTLTGEERSTTGNVAGLSNKFKAEGCGNLPFHPSFTASTQGATSKANGASLTVKVVPAAGQANIAKVDLTLPKQLPARLTTLQKACTEAQFNANPAGCPEASFIGTAIAHTPILANPLVGPAILVSHGGAAFPDVEFILQGEGVKIVLDGNTQIKNGITYSKFETVPDAPISSFETVLPEGPHSVLGTDLPASAHYSLCGQKLEMPTTITGQNGVVVNQTTQIAVTGCKAVKAKPLTRVQKLKAALKVCRTKDKGKSKAKRSRRVACEKRARKRYGPKQRKKAKHKKKE